MTRGQVGTLTEGVIPTRYKHVPCPKPGNFYVWLRDNCGPYWIQITAINAAGTGQVSASRSVQPGHPGGWRSSKRMTTMRAARRSATAPEPYHLTRRQSTHHLE